MTKQVKVPAAKADELCLVSRTPVVEREAPARCPLTATHLLWHAGIHPSPPTINILNKSLTKGWKVMKTPGIDLWPPHSYISAHVDHIHTK